MHLHVSINPTPSTRQRRAHVSHCVCAEGLTFLVELHIPLSPYPSIPLSPYPSIPLSPYPPIPLSLYPPIPLSPYPSIPLSPYPSIPLSPYPPIPLSPYPPIPLSPYPPIPLSLYPSIPLSPYPSIPLSLYPSIPLSLYPSIPLSPYPPIPLSLYPPIPLSPIPNSNCVEGARLLVDSGADPNIGDDGGITPLARAAALGYVDIVEVLLDCHRTNPNKQVHIHNYYIRKNLFIVDNTCSQCVCYSFLLATHFG